MRHGHDPKLRLGQSLRQASSFAPGLGDAPPLPVVNYAAVSRTAPSLLQTTAGALPKASTVVITWAEAEWAALEHVFCSGGAPMPYADRSRGDWPGWEKYAADLPQGAPSGWGYWGSYRLVALGGEPVLLFKSNTHLDWPGASFLRTLIERLVAEVEPALIMSIGTAGGAKITDHVGTVRAVSAATLYQAGQPANQWPEYKNGWTASDVLLRDPNFQSLLFAVPTTASDLRQLSAKFNQHYRTSYTLDQLDPDGLNLGDAVPQIDDQTGGGTSLLTTSSFVVGNTAGDYQAYSSIEMDDAVIGEACAASGTAFAFVRNVSDPVQNAALPAEAQGDWGSAVYDAYGFYTSYNGAIAAWAMLA